MTECMQQVVVQDTMSPTLVCPADTVAVCGVGEVAVFSSLTEFLGAGGVAVNNCGLIESTFMLLMAESDDTSCLEMTARTYEVADSCMNILTCALVLVINDTVSPTLTYPLDTVMVCSITEAVAFNDLQAFRDANGVADDNCGLVDSTFMLLSESSDDADCLETVLRIYLIADSCGNTSTCEQMVVVNDTIDPEFTCPADTALLCRISELPAVVDLRGFRDAGGTAMDNCGLIESTFTLVSEASDNSGCPEVFTRTYQIADTCGNVSSCMQTIAVADIVFPVFMCPLDTVAVCSSDEVVPFDNYADFMAADGIVDDNCGLLASTFTVIDEMSDGEACEETVTRIYELMDSCNNVQTCAHLILVKATMRPVLICPPDTLIECPDTLPVVETIEELMNIGGEVNDNCEIDSSSFWLIVDLSNGRVCPETIVRVYTVADLCDNRTVCEQIITVDDFTPPVVTCPAPDTLSCLADSLSIFLDIDDFMDAGGGVSDECFIDSSSFRLVSSESDRAVCSETITRVYSVSDSCRNVTMCTYTKVIYDCPGHGAVAEQIHRVMW